MCAVYDSDAFDGGWVRNGEQAGERGEGEMCVEGGRQCAPTTGEGKEQIHQGERDRWKDPERRRALRH